MSETISKYNCFRWHRSECGDLCVEVSMTDDGLKVGWAGIQAGCMVKQAWSLHTTHIHSTQHIYLYISDLYLVYFYSILVYPRIRNLILNTGTLSEGSNIINEIFYVF